MKIFEKNIKIVEKKIEIFEKKYQNCREKRLKFSKKKRSNIDGHRV